MTIAKLCGMTRPQDVFCAIELKVVNTKSKIRLKDLIVYISYYDEWDIGPVNPLEDLMGSPYEIYDRISEIRI